MGSCSSACPHDVPCPLSEQEGPCSITSCQVSSLPSSWPLSEWFRTFRTSQPTPKIVVWEATLREALRNHISATAGLTLRSSQPSLGGSVDPWSSDPSCYRGSEMQSLQTGQAQTRETGGSHTEEERPQLQSLDRCFPSPVEMPSQTGIEELCLGVDGHFGAEIGPRFLGSGGRFSEGREWDSSLCLAPHPQTLSPVLWVKMGWEPQKMFFGVGGGNCRWQTCVEHMCNGDCSPASARNDPLSFLSSHVSRSVSPTTISQIQARKKRRGVSVPYDDQGRLALTVCQGCPPVCTGGLLACPYCEEAVQHHLYTPPAPPPAKLSPKPIFFAEIWPHMCQKRGEQFHLGLSHQFTFLRSAFAPQNTHTRTRPFQSTWRALDP